MLCTNQLANQITTVMWYTDQPPNQITMVIWFTDQPTNPPISLVPRPTQKNRERGLVLLANFPVCAVSAVFVWSRGMIFIHCQLWDSLEHLHVMNVTSLWRSNVIIRMSCVICWLGTYGNFCKWHQAPFPIFERGLGTRLPTTLVMCWCLLRFAPQW